MNIEDKYKSYFSSRGVDPSLYIDAKLPCYLRTVFQKGKSILDIGCGFGQNMYALLNEGYTDIHGIDVSQTAVEYCLTQGLSVEHCDIMNYSGDRYDYVLMSHVLEHLPKECVVPILRKIREEILATDGALCIMVPNAQSNTDCYWAYEDFTHYTLFTAGSLLYVLREAGFTDIEFLDPDGLSPSAGWKKWIKYLLLKVYVGNKLFWNKVTGSAYHRPSPMIFTWELKCLAKGKHNANPM